LKAVQRKAQLFESSARKSPTFLRGDAEKKPNFFKKLGFCVLPIEKLGFCVLSLEKLLL